MSLDFDPDGPAAAGSGIFGLPHSADQAAWVLIPVPLEATTSYGRGTAAGPEAIARASVQVDLFDLQTGHPYRAGVAMIPPDEALSSLCFQANQHGAREPEDLEETNQSCGQVHDRVAELARSWQGRGKRVGVVGGDHSAALGLLRAQADGGTFGVLQVDAHADLRASYQGHRYSHASIMHCALDELPGLSKLVQVGVRDLGAAEWRRCQEDPRITTLTGTTWSRALLAGQSLVPLIDRALEGLPERVHVSFDIDGLEPSLCPNTGTPVPGGLSFSGACLLLERLVARGHRIIGFDLCEVAPGPAGSEWDANVGARMLWKLFGFALLSESQASGS